MGGTGHALQHLAPQLVDQVILVICKLFWQDWDQPKAAAQLHSM
jgi:hypothetical protein